jgi:signal peptidase II
LIDRLAYGEVIDFIDIHLWGGYTWPTFNVADSAIVLGVGLLLFEVFLGDQDLAEADESMAD